MVVTPSREEKLSEDTRQITDRTVSVANNFTAGSVFKNFHFREHTSDRNHRPQSTGTYPLFPGQAVRFFVFPFYQ
jgi:hypothetical protein